MTITLDEFLEGIRKRKADLGIVDTTERTVAMRNTGSRRTVSKRAALARINARAVDAGVAPLKAYF